MSTNCREYCPFRKLCEKDRPNLKPLEGKYRHMECPMYDKYDDILMDVETAMKGMNEDE